jgi:hypothetical protein
MNHTSIHSLPFDVLCYLLSRMSSVWLGVDLLELRLVSKQFLRACDSRAVSRAWRENPTVLLWQGKTLRFVPSLNECSCPRLLAYQCRAFARLKREQTKICCGALTWLHFAAVQSVARAVCSGRLIDKGPLKPWSSDRADCPLM